MTSAPFPKFASLCGNLSCELRKHMEHWQLYDSSAVYEFEIPAMDSRLDWQEFQIHRTRLGDCPTRDVRVRPPSVAQNE
jgi:hypothetical protein